LADLVATRVVEALSLRTSTVKADAFVVDRKDVSRTHTDLRTRFALRYQADAVDDDGVARPQLVRAAFNSPFWPFVLISTSVGQEGLDFHRYCHAVVHWNLPANPVDLEQREGRVHRYKGHAVRKNVAMVHGDAARSTPSQDPWMAMFAAAEKTRRKGETDVVPFWVYAPEGGARIERHVPAWPLSREQGRLADLRRTLAAYRMVIGQPRQDELLDYLLGRYSDEQLATLAEDLRIDLSPRHRR
jgi:hypothetical protein